MITLLTTISCCYHPIIIPDHGLSQQGIFLDTQTLEKKLSGHPIFLCGISKNLNLKIIIEFFISL